MFKSIVHGIVWMFLGLMIAICLFLTSGCSSKITEENIYYYYDSDFNDEEFNFITTLVAETIFNAQKMHWVEDRLILQGFYYNSNDELSTIWLAFRMNTIGDLFLFDIYTETSEDINVHPEDVKFLEDVINKYLQTN